MDNCHLIIENLPPLEKPAREQDLNPDPERQQAASLEDQGATCLRFFGIEPPQAKAQAKPQSKNTNIGLRMMAPKEVLSTCLMEARKVPL
ncbi:hypothetical protein DSO57_1015551 [Entomophthora muscae]|uniref:Uncharacterized protein n=1 Tax=Entomophthora muscae TaxID=34485 RepID=A0ACC2S721_9FUNG|nr:hypothetical protein DSO57_1015551 [Entomophthora muscae]